MDTEEVVSVSQNALNLSWAFGFNALLPNLVHSLESPSSAAGLPLLYVSAHTAIVHDTDNSTQKPLQGHCNPITAVCVSTDKKWIATADSGPESLIIVWETEKGVPVKTIPNPHPLGVISMDISPDSTFLVTLGEGKANISSSPQTPQVCVLCNPD